MDSRYLLVEFSANTPSVLPVRELFDVPICINMRKQKTMTATAKINGREAWYFDRDPTDIMRGIWLWSDTNVPIELN